MRSSPLQALASESLDKFSSPPLSTPSFPFRTLSLSPLHHPNPCPPASYMNLNVFAFDHDDFVTKLLVFPETTEGIFQICTKVHL